MANTKISDLGDRRIAISGLPEIRKPALGDGTAKPGDIVGINSSGKVVQTQVGTSELFDGILDDEPILAEDTAIPDGYACSVIVPQSGHLYRCKMEDAGGSVAAGMPHAVGSTAGALEDTANLNTATPLAKLEKAIVDNDTVGEFRWL